MQNNNSIDAIINNYQEAVGANIVENHVINEITADVDSDIKLPTINLEQPNTEITENESTNDSESEVEDAPAVNLPRTSNSLNKSLSSSLAATNSIKFPSLTAFKVKFNSLVKKYIPAQMILAKWPMIKKKHKNEIFQMDGIYLDTMF